jgi:hypothetical protein
VPRDVAPLPRAAVAAPPPPLEAPRPETAEEARTPQATASRVAEPEPAAAARIKEPKLGPGVFQLQAISAQEGHPVAILNDRLVREGDTFDGVRVVRIGADEVEIEVAGRRRVLKF